MTKISVVIPIYNTASYLSECLDSVFNQPFDDVEVICVNDGSTDSTMDVLRSYESRYDNIIVINQENKGSGAARNAAIPHITGEYVLFLDSDDYLDEDSLNILYHLATTKDLDVIMFKMINFDNETYREIPMDYFEMPFVKDLVGDSVFDWTKVKNRLFDISVTAPGKFFKRDLVMSVPFPEGVIFEDNLFFIKLVFKAKRMYFYDEYLYNRRLRKNSVTISYYNRFSDCLIIYDAIADFLRQIGVYDQFAEQLFNRKCRDVYKRFTAVGEEHKETFFKRIKFNFKQNKDSLEREGTIKICSERSLEIFNSALDSNTPREFELAVGNFDLKRDIDKLKLEKNMLERSYKKKFNQLNKKSDEYKNEVDVMKNSTSWRITKHFRKVTSFIKSKLN